VEGKDRGRASVSFLTKKGGKGENFLAFLSGGETRAADENKTAKGGALPFKMRVCNKMIRKKRKAEKPTGRATSYLGEGKKGVKIGAQPSGTRGRLVQGPTLKLDWAVNKKKRKGGGEMK